MARTGYTSAAPRRQRRSEQDWRQEIVQVCQLMWQKDYLAASDGNVSVRLDEEHFLVTPSGLSKGFITADQLLVIDWDAQPVGPRYGVARDLRPSSEILLHLEVYRRRPDVVSVVHAHPAIAVALSIAGISLAQCILPEVVMSLGLIPTSDYATPASAEGPKVIAGLIESYDAIILQRHGSVTVGASPWEAYLKLEKVEHTAKITKTVLELGGDPPMPADQVAKAAAWRAERGRLQGRQAADICDACGVCDLAGIRR